MGVNRDDRLTTLEGRAVDAPDERAVYEALGMAWIPPELREGRGETLAAARGALPELVESRDIRGVLHCHSQYSDGKATIAELAEAARQRGWRYLGISDHSVSAFYAGRPAPLPDGVAPPTDDELAAADDSTW